MSSFSTFVVLLTLGVTVNALPKTDIKGFHFLGKAGDSFYFLSNSQDKRSVSDARVGCHDSFHNGQLVALETDAEHNEIRQRLSSWGVTDRDRVWTTGQYDGTEWVWYDFVSNEITPIVNACTKPWVANNCPIDGCLAIGGRDLTFKWQADDCDLPRRYLCEYPA